MSEQMETIFKDAQIVFEQEREKEATMYEQAIQIAADDISKLRECDVYRVLEWNRQNCALSGLALWIKENRPDLASEVNTCVTELEAST